MNYWLRMRVLMQGLTIVAFLGGVYRVRQEGPGWGIWGVSSEHGKRVDALGKEQAAREKAEFLGRLEKAEEAHRIEHGLGATGTSDKASENKKGTGIWGWMFGGWSAKRPESESGVVKKPDS